MLPFVLPFGRKKGPFKQLAKNLTEREKSLKTNKNNDLVRGQRFC
jgi:hypothetical protein